MFIYNYIIINLYPLDYHSIIILFYSFYFVFHEPLAASLRKLIISYQFRIESMLFISTYFSVLLSYYTQPKSS